MGLHCGDDGFDPVELKMERLKWRFVVSVLVAAIAGGLSVAGFPELAEAVRQVGAVVSGLFAS